MFVTILKYISYQFRFSSQLEPFKDILSAKFDEVLIEN